jgi:hypothetical protein
VALCVVFDNYLILLVQSGGLEPPTSGSTIRRSNQLSYDCTGLQAFRERRKLWACHPKSKHLNTRFS